MFSFKDYLTEAVRTGLPSIESMSHEQFNNLSAKGHIHVKDVTEKTDGSVFHLHYDHKGFGTQYSGSGDEIMSSKEDYHTRAKRRAEETGKEHNPVVPAGFGRFHDALSKHKRLQTYMKSEYERTGNPVHIKGEAYNRFMGDSQEGGKKHQWAGTSYDTNSMGKHGSFVIHSKLPGNEEHAKNIKHLSGEDESGVHIEDDKIKHTPAKVDISHERKEFEGLNHELINSRTTKTNKVDKEAEVAKFNDIKKRASDKVDSHFDKTDTQPKWSKEGNSEGFVVHPVGQAPRFKVTSKKFRAYRADPSTKEKWAKK